jgi:hydrogenase maturation factor
MHFILNDLNVMGALPQGLKIIFKMQSKMSNEFLKARRKISFSSYKTQFVFLDPF